MREQRQSGALRVLVALVSIIAWLVPRSAAAQHLTLPPILVALDSPEGQRFFDEADARADYWSLSEHYVTQRSGNFCGVASAVMALNAMQVRAPLDEHSGALFYTQDDFFNECARRVLSPTLMPGMTLDQLADLLQCHPATARAVHAADTTLADFREIAAKNLATPGDYVLVNYDRAGTGLEPAGHISPLGAYDAMTDKFLLLDVARYKYPPVWVNAATLFDAMRTDDFSSGKTRGFVIVSAAASPPGPTGARAARNIIHIAIGLLVAAFVLGLLLGAALQTRRLKRRFARQATSPQPSG